MNPHEYLLEWFERFLKNRDIMLRKIVELKREEDKIIVKEKHKEIAYVVSQAETLRTQASSFDADAHCGIVLYNTQENLEAFVRDFEVLSEHKHLVVHFINPFSKGAKRWTIIPHTHAKIADPQSLELGLKSMFESVDAITQEELQKIIE